MVWIPNIDVFLSPMKLQIDVDYILRVLGIVISSASKYQSNLTQDFLPTSSANDKLLYVTRGQMHVCLTYIEQLYIAPVHFDIELDIKPDESNQSVETGVSEESSLTLHTIAQSTDSGE
jgi:hypothetical protein